jgi:hypothetical protein
MVDEGRRRRRRRRRRMSKNGSIGLEVYVGQLGRHPLCIYAATKRIKVAAKKDINRR